MLPRYPLFVNNQWNFVTIKNINEKYWQDHSMQYYLSQSTQMATNRHAQQMIKHY